MVQYLVEASEDLRLRIQSTARRFVCIMNIVVIE
jgi:hypothetical protein